MVKIIFGARYNSDTAKKIGSIQFGSPGDSRHYEETLFRTKAGKFFIHGCGGAASPYNTQTGPNSWGAGERIVPISKEAAWEWAEKNLDTDSFEAVFEATPTVAVTAYLTKDILLAVDAYKTEKNCSRSEVIGAALKEYLSN